MPSLNLTPQQQSQIDAANLVLANAQKEYDQAISSFNSVSDNFCNQGWWQYLSNCDIRSAQSKAYNTAVTISALYTLGATAILNNLTQRKWTPPASCQDAIDKGVIVTWECNRGHKDCTEKGTCNTKVNEYNAKLQGYYSAFSAVGGAQTKLQSAKNNLDAVVSAIQKDPTVQANADIIKNEENNAASKKRMQVLFFGLAAVAIIGAAIWIGTRAFKGGA